jgi:hypothetical protein
MKWLYTSGLALLVAGALTYAAIFAQDTAVEVRPDGEWLRALGEVDAGRSALWGQNGWKLREQSHQLAKQYVKSEREEEKKEIRKKLIEVLAKQFDGQMKQQEKELTDLEKQIASLKSLLKKRQDAKATIIDRRMEQLIHEADGLGWSAPSTPQSGAQLVPGNRFPPSQ